MVDIMVQEMYERGFFMVSYSIVGPQLLDSQVLNAFPQVSPI